MIHERHFDAKFFSHSGPLICNTILAISFMDVNKEGNYCTSVSGPPKMQLHLCGVPTGTKPGDPGSDGISYEFGGTETNVS